MLTGPALGNLAAAVVRACRSGLDANALRAAVLPRLRKAVPIDAPAFSWRVTPLCRRS